MLAQAFGISSLVLSIVAIFVPAFGVFITGLSGICAWVSTGRAAVLGLAAVIINLCNIFFFSPTFALLIALESTQRSPEQSKAFALWGGVLVIQLAALVVFLINVLIFKFIRKQQAADPLPASGQANGSGEELPSIEQDDDFTLSLATEDPHPRLSRLTRVLIQKTRGGRKEGSSPWLNGLGQSELGKNGGGGKRLFVVTPLVVGFILMLGGIAGIVIYNLYFRQEPYVPLSRVYERPRASTELSAPTAEQPLSTPSASGTYYTEEDDGTRVLSRDDDRIFSYKDTDGRIKYTNTSPPDTGESVRLRPELTADRITTPVEIKNGNIYVPVTIEHKGNRFDTSFLLDSKAAHTVLPARNANLLKADYLGPNRYHFSEGVGTVYEIRKVDLFMVGPKQVRDFMIVVQGGEQALQRGVLGRDFLNNLSFTVDEEQGLLRWQ